MGQEGVGQSTEALPAACWGLGGAEESGGHSRGSCAWSRMAAVTLERSGIKMCVDGRISRNW